MASTPTATPPPANSSTSAPPPANSSTSAPPATNSSASGTSPPPQPSPLPVSPPPSPSPPANAPPPPPPSPTSTQPPPSPPPPNSTSFSSSSASPPPPKTGDASTLPPLPPSKSLSPPAPPPPPRSPSHSLPSYKTPSSANDADTSSENRHSGNSGQSDVSLQIIIGVTTGIGILLLMMIVASVLCCSEKKKKKKKPMDYYGALGPNGAGGYYGGGSLAKWQNAEQRTDYPGNLPRPPGAAGFSPYPNALPPPQMYSGESSTNSGPHGGGGAAAMQALSPPLGFSKSSFTYDALATATNGFARENILGQGGFGFVYKGVLPNGLVVAVKQLKSGSGQGEREFQAEVEIISRVHHRHLVSLVGYCIAGSQRLLVYEFVTNNTLEHHLHVKEAPALDWPTRLKIAIGSAKGLAYLHEDCHPRIIHRDIKTANILLDNNFEAMVADFGLAKFNSDTNTHVSTRIMGTFGYLAPEYASTGKLTEKSDVFSFGVMLLELITGRRPVDPTGYMEDSLADWSRPLITQALADKNFDELVDQRLENKYNVEEMTRMIASAGACVRHSARKRPKMSQIVRALEGDVSLDDLNEATKAAGLHSSSSDFDSSDAYSSKMKGFRLVALESNEYGSNEYSGGTSEYGLNPSESSNSNSSGEVNSSRRTANRSSS